MGVKVKFNENWEKFKNDPMAFADRFPCPQCDTMSKKVADMEFYCPTCDGNFKLNVTYTSNSQSSDADSETKSV